MVRCLWHPKLNQIVVGCADGKAKVFFSSKYSFRYDTISSDVCCMGLVGVLVTWYGDLVGLEKEILFVGGTPSAMS